MKDDPETAIELAEESTPEQYQEIQQFAAGSSNNTNNAIRALPGRPQLPPPPKPGPWGYFPNDKIRQSSWQG